MPQFHVLHGRETSLVLEDRAGAAPLWRYWGPRLADGFAAGPPLADEPCYPGFHMEPPTRLALFPGLGLGWFHRAALEALAAGLGNIQFHDLQPAARMGELLALAAVHLLPQIPGAADLVLPSKLTNMLASGRPVVATVAPGTGLAAEVEGCGLVSAPGDAVALAGAVTALLDDPDLAARCGVAARERALDRWSQQAIIDRLAERLRGLAG